MNITTQNLLTDTISWAETTSKNWNSQSHSLYSFPRSLCSGPLDLADGRMGGSMPKLPTPGDFLILIIVPSYTHYAAAAFSASFRFRTVWSDRCEISDKMFTMASRMKAAPGKPASRPRVCAKL